jgi:hypothetical protein
MSVIVRSTLKPQQAMTMTSGCHAITSSQCSRRDGCPSRPSPSTPPARRVSDLLHRVEDLGQRLRLEIDHARPARKPARGRANLGVGHGAHVTECLRDDEIGLQRLEHVEVERVQRAVRRQPFADEGVDFRTWRVGRNERPRDLRQITHDWGIVALVRHTDEVGLETECADHLGRARQQGHDAGGHGRRSIVRRNDEYRSRARIRHVDHAQISALSARSRPCRW